MRLIKVSYPDERSEAVISAIEDAEPVDWMKVTDSDSYEKAIEIVASEGQEQAIVDALQDIFQEKDDWRITVLSVEVSLPREDDPLEKSKEEIDKKPAAFREGLYESVEKGSCFDLDFAVLTVLSVIVAAIGLNSDNVAVVIAAMVIAPLLGPMLGFSFGAALGDMSLMIAAARTVLIASAISFVIALLLVQVFPLNTKSAELLDRAVMRPEMIALALASGAAAALSLTTGAASALVGVMVAVALLPPLVASGMFWGVGDVVNGTRAGIVLTVNIVCTVLAAQLVFVWKGIRPRTWWEKQAAARSVKINLAFWGILLVVLAVIIFIFGGGADK